jgi:F-type H+-transporting ATPase subunit a
MTILMSAQKYPRIPNILTLLEKYFRDSPWIAHLHHWESIVFSLFIACTISLIFYLGSRNTQTVPGGFQNFLEWVVETFQSFVVGVLGPEGVIYVPFLGTLFIYILSMNLLGLVPLMASPSSNLNITLALAICVFVLVQYLNIKNMGLKGFLYHLAGSPTNAIGWLMAPLMFPIEILTQISRPITLALRLFGNILGEKILVAFFATVSVTFLYFFPIQLPFMFLGLLTNVMQAMVFTLLSTIYILLSIPHSGEIHINHEN